MLRLLGIIFFVLVLGVGYIAYDAHTFLTTPASADSQDVIVAIAPGATFDRVAWDLKKAGAITDVTRFRLLGQYKKALGSIRVGEYAVNTGWTPAQVLEHITKGKPVMYRLSVREGLTWWETARAVADQGFATYEDFVEVIHDPAFLRTHGIPFTSPEGFLFPETYLLNKPRTLDRAQAESVASLMVRTFWKKTLPAWKYLPARTSPAEAQDFGAAVKDIGAGTAPLPLDDVFALARKSVTAAEEKARLEADQSPARADAQVLLQNAPLAAGDGEETQEPEEPGQQSGQQPGNATSAAAPGATHRVSGTESAQTAGNGTVAVSAPNTAGQSGTTGNISPESLPSHIRSKGKVADNPAQVAPKALKELVIMASLVEKETGVPSERAKVAGVYANRLHMGMFLQCDPTIIYGVGQSFKGAIRRSQLNDATNRYNTYQHAGLPPGPISSFGLDAFMAAFYPEVHPYIYFVATGLDKGHTFSTSLKDHNAAVRVYRSRVK